VALSSTATGTVPAPGGGWSYNGSASITAGAATLLTRAGAVDAAGTVVYPRAVNPASFSATFNVAMGSGTTNGDGITLALLNPGSKATSVGKYGTGLGFAGLSGTAVVLGTTMQISGAPSADFVGVETGTAGGTPSLMATTDLTGSIDLRAGTHTVTVTFNAGTLTVAIDGTTVLTHTVAVPTSAYVAFTASSGTGTLGSVTDRHLVQNAGITAG
jgi:hypothetical protein